METIAFYMANGVDELPEASLFAKVYVYFTFFFDYCIGILIIFAIVIRKK